MRSRRVTGVMAAAIAMAAVTAVTGCSTSGRELPAPTTTRPPTPQVVATVTTR